MTSGMPALPPRTNHLSAASANASSTSRGARDERSVMVLHLSKRVLASRPCTRARPESAVLRGRAISRTRSRRGRLVARACRCNRTGSPDATLEPASWPHPNQHPDPGQHRGECRAETGRALGTGLELAREPELEVDDEEVDHGFHLASSARSHARLNSLQRCQSSSDGTWLPSTYSVGNAALASNTAMSLAETMCRPMRRSLILSASRSTLTNRSPSTRLTTGLETTLALIASALLPGLGLGAAGSLCVTDWHGPAVPVAGAAQLRRRNRSTRIQHRLLGGGFGAGLGGEQSQLQRRFRVQQVVPTTL